MVGLPKKGGAWTVYRFKGGELGKKEEGGVFESVDTKVSTMVAHNIRKIFRI